MMVKKKKKKKAMTNGDERIYLLLPGERARRRRKNGRTGHRDRLGIVVEQISEAQREIEDDRGNTVERYLNTLCALGRIHLAVLMVFISHRGLQRSLALLQAGKWS